MRKVLRMEILNNELGKNGEFTNEYFIKIYACYVGEKVVKYQLEVKNKIVLEGKYLGGLLQEMLYLKLDELPDIKSKDYFFKKLRLTKEDE